MKTQTQSIPTSRLTAKDLRQMLLDAGADDAAHVSIEHEGVANESGHVLEAMPGTKTLVSYCVKMNREPIRSPDRAQANSEFHHSGHDVGEIGRRVVRALQERGVRAMSPPVGFPMDSEKFPGRMWVVSHKTVAEASGLGVMGIHRIIIHPKFGNSIALGTLMVESECDAPAEPLDYNPCFECKLCVSACPVGAIGSDGYFDFSACYTHNYREFMGGFTDWVEQIADSKDGRDYSKRVTDQESVSMWQSLSFGANYKAAYCMAACPAGDEVIGPFQENRGQYVKSVVKPLQRKEEPIYVRPGSDAEAYAAKRFPHKPLRHVGKVLRPSDVDGFVRGMPLVFQRGRVTDANTRLHFVFRGASERQITVEILAGQLRVMEGLQGKADLTIRADAASWVRFIRGDLSLPGALLRGRIRLRGSWKHLLVLDRAFP